MRVTELEEGRPTCFDFQFSLVLFPLMEEEAYNIGQSKTLANKGELKFTMEIKTSPIAPQKRIALIAHDNKKQDLLDWAKFNRQSLAQHIVLATGTTGKMLEQLLGIEIIKLQSGPLGGDQQIGAKIAEGEVDFVIFFWDPLEPQPHDPDVKALLRLAVVWNIPIACNRASADFMFSSQLMGQTYQRILPDYDVYRTRTITTMEPETPEPIHIDSSLVEVSTPQS